MIRLTRNAGPAIEDLGKTDADDNGPFRAAGLEDAREAGDGLTPVQGVLDLRGSAWPRDMPQTRARSDGSDRRLTIDETASRSSGRCRGQATGGYINASRNMPKRASARAGCGRCEHDPTGARRNRSCAVCAPRIRPFRSARCRAGSTGSQPTLRRRSCRATPLGGSRRTPRCSRRAPAGRRRRRRHGATTPPSRRRRAPTPATAACSSPTALARRPRAGARRRLAEQVSAERRGPSGGS